MNTRKESHFICPPLPPVPAKPGSMKAQFPPLLGVLRKDGCLLCWYSLRVQPPSLLSFRLRAYWHRILVLRSSYGPISSASFCCISPLVTTWVVASPTAIRAPLCCMG